MPATIMNDSDLSEPPYVSQLSLRVTSHHTRPDVAMLFAPFGSTHPRPPVPSFLLTQNLSPKDIARSDIMKLKVS